MKIEDAINRALTGARRQKPTVCGTIKDAEKAFGSKRAIASQLGVSTRTVQRWASGKGKPSKGNAGRLDGLRRAPEVRRAVAPRKRGGLRRDAKLKIDGYQGPISGPNDHRRQRLVTGWTVDGEHMNQMIDAWESGDDAAAAGALKDWFETEYGVSGWEFGEVDELDFV